MKRISGVLSDGSKNMHEHPKVTHKSTMIVFTDKVLSKRTIDLSLFPEVRDDSRDCIITSDSQVTFFIIRDTICHYNRLGEAGNLHRIVRQSVMNAMYVGTTIYPQYNIRRNSISDEQMTAFTYRLLHD